jgi:peroxiredoxin
MKPAVLIQLAFIVLAGLAVYGFVSMARDAESRRACVPACVKRPNYAGRNRLAPDFELDDVNGGKVRLSDFKGKTVVLNFWTTTCQPCLEEMPSLAELANVLKTRRRQNIVSIAGVDINLGYLQPEIVVLTVSTDANKEIAMSALKTLLHQEKGAKAADEDFRPPFRVLLDPESNVVQGKYGTQLFPETWIIDTKGIIRARFDGARDWADAMWLDLIESFERPASCEIEFESGKPSGPDAPYCDESGSG